MQTDRFDKKNLQSQLQAALGENQKLIEKAENIRENSSKEIRDLKEKLTKVERAQKTFSEDLVVQKIISFLCIKLFFLNVPFPLILFHNRETKDSMRLVLPNFLMKMRICKCKSDHFNKKQINCVES